MNTWLVGIRIRVRPAGLNMQGKATTARIAALAFDPRRDDCAGFRFLIILDADHSPREIGIEEIDRILPE